MRRFLLIAALGALAWATPHALAQGSISQEVITARAPLTEAQRAQIEAFITPRVEAIAQGDAVEVSQARYELAQVPRTPGASDIFRRGFADAARAGLRPTFASTDEFRAANALAVLPFLYTAESLDELAENAPVNRQSSEAVRIMVARSLALSAQNLAAPNAPYALTTAQADALVRKLGDAARDETSWLALAELGMAVAEIGNWKSLPDANRDNARQGLRMVLEREVALLRDDPSGEMMRAIQRTLGDLQTQILEMRGASRSSFAQQIQPVLKSLREVTAKPPAGLPEATLRAYDKAEKSADLIDRMLAGP